MGAGQVHLLRTAVLGRDRVTSYRKILVREIRAKSPGHVWSSCRERGLGTWCGRSQRETASLNHIRPALVAPASRQVVRHEAARAVVFPAPHLVVHSCRFVAPGQGVGLLLPSQFRSSSIGAGSEGIVAAATSMTT